MISMSWSELLLSQKPDDHEGLWAKSPFYWYKKLPGWVIKGDVGHCVCLNHFEGTSGPAGAGYDVLAKEKKIEVKISSCSYKSGNAHAWNQIRVKQEWEWLFLVAIEVDVVRAFFIPKSSLYSKTRPKKALPRISRFFQKKINSFRGKPELGLYGGHHGSDAINRKQPLLQLKTFMSEIIPENLKHYEIEDVDWKERLQNCKPEEKYNEWVGSDFEWIVELDNIATGNLAENMYVSAFGGKIRTSKSLGYDIIDGDKNVEAKFSSYTYRGSLGFQWNQVRKEDDYTHLFLVAVEYDSVRAFLLEKRFVVEQLYNQHGGEDGTQLLATSTSEPYPSWLVKHEVYYNGY